MNKIICDVCGTAYPETAAQCPICGCAKPDSGGMPPLDGGEGAVAERSYTYVKGGRFSKSNVRKRNKANGTYRNYDPDDDDLIEQELPPSNKGLIIAVVLLLLAIAAVVVYIVLNFGSSAEPSGATEPSSVQTQPDTQPSSESTDPGVQTTPSTEDTLPEDLSCTGLTPAESVITLTQPGEERLINVTVTPENTDDPITYVSADPGIATVSDSGRVTAVAAGSTEITVTCGDISAVITVDCNLPQEGLDPNAKYDMRVNKKTYVNKSGYKEATLSKGDAPFQLTFWKMSEDGQTGVEQVDVEWVIEDTSVCVKEGDDVKYVGRGRTTIRVKVDGKIYDEYVFTVICS